jgi:hypothetical protein
MRRNIKLLAIAALAAWITVSGAEPLVAQVTPELTRARDVSRRRVPGLLGRPGVMGGGVGLSKADGTTPVIRVYVHKDTPPQDKASLPTDLEGVPVELVEMPRMKARRSE